MVKITVCKCIECGNILSYSMQSQPKEFNKQYCFTCLLNFTGMVQMFELQQFPHNQDVYAATQIHNKNQQTWRNNCIKVLERLRIWKEQKAIAKLDKKRDIA